MRVIFVFTPDSPRLPWDNFAALCAVGAHARCMSRIPVQFFFFLLKLFCTILI